jgi:hypothetical protein
MYFYIFIFSYLYSSLCLYCFIFFASFVFHPFLLFILFYLPIRGYTLVYSFSLTEYLYVFQLVSPAQPSQITLLPRNASPCQVRMNARQPVESRQTMDNRVARLEERTRAWDSTLKVRLSGFTALSKRCHDLAAGTRQFWKLKQEIADLILIDLGPHLKELFPVTANNIQNELVESLKEEFLVAIFPTGAKWPNEKSIDIVMKPGLPSMRMNLLVRCHIQPKLRSREDLNLDLWVPMTQDEMERRSRRQQRGRESGRSRSRKS